MNSRSALRAASARVRAWQRRALHLTWLIAAATCSVAPAAAAVRGVVVTTQQNVLDGTYEKLAGTVELELDPSHPRNGAIVDLRLAPRNDRGQVEASADFMVLRPRQVRATPPAALVEISNRGGKAVLPYFNGAPWSPDPTTDDDFGDRLLMRLGFTVMWIGWQFDVPRQPGLLRLRTPIATDNGRPLQGLVRCDWTVERRTTTLALGHHDHIPYAIVDPTAPDNVLTVREARLGPRRVVPREQWRFAREGPDGIVEDHEHIYLGGGFLPGRIYELVYRARDPAVVGIGLAAVRDFVSWARHDPHSPFPIGPAIAVGISQSGRFLRHFVYQGFNTDEAGRRVFDGMLVHSAGAGRGSFNHRFAQPSRDAHRFSAFFYPTDLFPFTGRVEKDPASGVEDGLFAHEPPEHHARTFFTNTGYEYWGRAGSLIHTSVDGHRDLAPLAHERIYHLAGGQHFVGRFPPAAEPVGTGYRENPLDFLPTLRALLVRLRDWVVDGREPPPSAYPTLASGTLVPIRALKLPSIPGIRPPQVAHEAYRVDYGPDWRRGIITIEPPRVGPAYTVRVPQVDDVGNELGGVRGLELLAPLATYTPWQLRGGSGPEAGELTDFLGTYIPWPRSDAERRRTGDGRPSLENRYPGKRGYLAVAARAAESLVGAGFLLREDVPRVLERAERHWDWLMRRP